MRRPSKRPPPVEPRPKRRSEAIPDGAPLGVSIHHDSAVERVLARNFVLNFANSGATLSRIIREGALRRPIPLDETEVTTIYRTHLIDIKRAYAHAVDTFRELQVERLMNDCVRLRMGSPVMRKDGTVMTYTRQNPDGTTMNVELRKVDEAALNQKERLLADITGTMAPKVLSVNLDKDLTDAVNRVVAAIDPEERERIIAEQKKLEEDAEEGRKLKLVQGGKR